jgi:hypothetical protein
VTGVQTCALPISIGVFFYHIDKEKSEHAVNVILVNDRNSIKVGMVFYDPTLSKVVILTQKEIDSCFFVYF